MEEILASANQVIELQEDGKWRLARDEEFRRQTLVEAQLEGPILFYHKDFGQSRGLPARNWLTAEQIQEIMVGWAPQERCWILGMQVDQEKNGQTRWCELVRFPVSQPLAYGTQAQRAARALAGLMGCPLRIIRARPSHETPTTAPRQHPSPPKPHVAYRLPVLLPNQRLVQTSGGLRLMNSGQWILNQVVTIFFYCLLGLAFGFLSLKSINTPYAPVNEAWLPYVGLALMVVLAGMGVWQGVRVFRATDVIFQKERGALYYVSSMGRWIKPLRRQVREPMPLRAIKAVVARNLTPSNPAAEWILFLQTVEDTIVLSHIAELSDSPPPSPLQAAAAIADILDIPMRVIMRGVGTDDAHTYRCSRCGTMLTADRLHWREDGQVLCTVCGAPIDVE